MNPVQKIVELLVSYSQEEVFISKIHFFEICGCMSALLHFYTVLPANRREKLDGIAALQEIVVKEKDDGQKIRCYCSCD